MVVVRAACLYLPACIRNEHEYVVPAMGLRVLVKTGHNRGGIAAALGILTLEVARETREHIVVVVDVVAQRYEHYKSPHKSEEQPEREE